jgi:hypothetical protein
MVSKLIIGHPVLSFSKNVVRVSCDIREENDQQTASPPKTITFDVDKRWGQYLVLDNVNAQLVGLLPYAMRNQLDIELLAPVSSDLLHNIELVLIPHLVKFDDRLHHTKIHAHQLDVTGTENAGAVGTGISLGVDSFFTIAQYANSKHSDFRLTHLFVEQVGDLFANRLSTKHQRNVNQETVDDVADALNLPVIYGYSNIRQLFRMNHQHTHTYTAMFHIHMMAKLWSSYLYSSGVDFSHFNLAASSTADAAYHELLSLQALSTRSLQLFSGGVSSDRVEKTKELASNELAQKYLRVCLVQESNCMKCEKCRRTLLTIDMQGHLDKFQDAFDIPFYRNNRGDYLTWLVDSFKKDRSATSITELYEFFQNAEPGGLEQLETEINEAARLKTIVVPGYLRLTRAVRTINPETRKRSLLKKKPQDIYCERDFITAGVHYFVTAKSHGRNSIAVPFSVLEKIEFRAFTKPISLRVVKKTNKVDPYRRLATGREIEAGTVISFSESIVVDNITYFRSRHDSTKNNNLALPQDVLAELSTK